MTKSEAQSILDRVRLHRDINGPMSDLPAGINKAEVERAGRIVLGEEPENAPVVTGHPKTGAPVSPEEHRKALEELTPSHVPPALIKDAAPVAAPAAESEEAPAPPAEPEAPAARVAAPAGFGDLVTGTGRSGE